MIKVIIKTTASSENPGLEDNERYERFIFEEEYQFDWHGDKSGMPEKKQLEIIRDFLNNL